MAGQLACCLMMTVTRLSSSSRVLARQKIFSSAFSALIVRTWARPPNEWPRVGAERPEEIMKISLVFYLLGGTQFDSSCGERRTS